MILNAVLQAGKQGVLGIKTKDVPRINLGSTSDGPTQCFHHRNDILASFLPRFSTDRLMTRHQRTINLTARPS